MTDDERWKYVDERLAQLSGELLATRIISSIALDWLVAAIPDANRRTAQMRSLASVVDTAIQESTFVGGHDEAAARTKAIAQARADEVLSKISAMRTKPS